MFLFTARAAFCRGHFAIHCSSNLSKTVGVHFTRANHKRRPRPNTVTIYKLPFSPPPPPLTMREHKAHEAAAMATSSEDLASLLTATQAGAL